MHLPKAFKLPIFKDTGRGLDVDFGQGAEPMRAMILAAGLGTRLRPLTDLRAKPALPIRGRPVISLLLDFLSRQGICEVLINLHHLPQTIRAAVDADCPRDMKIIWSEESEPLGTGGGIRRASEFLSRDDECVVLAGDMLIDIDLASLLETHRRSRLDATLVLREDERKEAFGAIDIDDEGNVTRVGKRIVHAKQARPKTGRSERSGLFTGVRIFSKDVFEGWPDADVFEDLRDWLIPGIEADRLRVGGVFVDARDSVWEPVGTPSEYLRMNLCPPSMPSLGGAVDAWAGDVEIAGARADVILGSRSEIGNDARLERAVVWAGETVPASFVARDGVFAEGRFHDCGRGAAALGQEH
jgi:NDP-sugar pyrophosphorylase family protein